LRFGSPRAPGFAVSAAVDQQLKVIETSVRFGLPRRLSSRRD